jgi:hypothetical protein
MADVTETVAMIVRKEVRLAEEREYCPLNDDCRYEQGITPIISALVEGLARVNHITLPSKELADRFCAKIRAAEALRNKRNDLLPESFIDSMQRAGCLTDSDDTIAAVLLMEEFAALTPGEIPPTDDERHYFETGDEVVEFFERFDGWEGHELVTRLTLDGKYCVDVASV